MFRTSQHAALSIIIALFFSSAAFSQTIKLSPGIVPPSTSTQVSGSGFSRGDSIDIFFDTTDEALAIADSSGSFSNIAISVPASALPGLHSMSAIPRSGRTGTGVMFKVYTNWKQEGFTSARTGFNPYENVLNPNTVSAGLALKWSHPINGGYDSSPVVAKGVVYVTSGFTLYALHTDTGAKLWRYSNPSYPLVSSPVIANGVVYVIASNYRVYALDARTGALLWSTSPGVRCAVSNGVVYVSGGSKNKVTALNATTGATLWSYNTGLEVFSPPAVANGVVYIIASLSHNDSVYALDAGTGALLWTYAIDGFASSSPTVANGVVYVAGYGQQNGSQSFYVALQASTGVLLKTYTVGVVANNPPAVANGVIYFATGDGEFHALKVDTGATLWSTSLGNTSSPIYSAPTVANGVVYFGSGDFNVYALDAGTGVKLWNYTTGGDVFASLAVANGKVYVGSEDGNLYAFGATSLPEEEEFPPPDLRTLQPNFSLLPSQPAATPPSNDDN